ncbi:molybdate ABC transporter permease subunit [Luteolibacter pohnpeiensis]|uniref:Molybdenum transport system permease n=1 Tax=Luteolibacter pohnpeiensis TaxID=454153 RepID=A0A934S3S2_9BACT|nr:molybdate ABC transporter permease subunit [Luteolibacter pohnpeiensis]MBK1881368.1 molybdate ABC transporter permease subunit [Luteolibacter pohnpeiensis]
MKSGDWHIVFLTMGASALAVAIALPFAIALSWLLARREWFGKSLVETLASLPLVMPPVAIGLLLLKLLGRNGPIGGWLHRSFEIDVVFTWKAVVIALAVMVFPLLVRSIRTAFEEIPSYLEEAGANLGRSPCKVFFLITIPLARRGISAGILLAFARALGEFGATVMVAGFIPGVTETLPLAIYRSVQTGDDSRALWLAGLSGLVAFAAIWLSSRLVGRSSRRSL